VDLNPNDTANSHEVDRELARLVEALLDETITEAEAAELEAADIADKSLDVDSDLEADLDERIQDELAKIDEVTDQNNGEHADD